MKVGKQIAEPLRIHLDMSRADAKATSLRLLEDVGIPNRRSASSSTRTSCPAACGSGS